VDFRVGGLGNWVYSMVFPPCLPTVSFHLINHPSIDPKALLEACHVVSKGAALLFDRNTHACEWVESGYESIIGYSPAEICEGGLDVLLNRIHPEDLPFLGWNGDGNSSSCTLNGQSLVAVQEYRVRHRSGEWRWLLTNWIPLHKGDADCILAMSWDITPQKVEQEELQRSRALLAEAQQLVGLGCFEFYPGMGDHAWSESLFQLFQRDPADGPMSLEEVLGSVHPEDRQRFLEWRTFLPQGGAPDLEYRCVCKDGKQLLLHSRAQWVPHPDGRQGRVFGVTQDLTEQKYRETELQESVERFHELAGRLPQTVFETNRNGCFTYVNHCGTQVSGYSEDELVGRVATSVLAPADRAQAIRDFLDVMDGGVSGHEYTAMRKDGSTFPVVVHSAPIVRNSQVVGLRGILVDLSEQRRTREEQRNLHERLVQAEKMEAIGQLAGGVAHDFNNHLSAIMGFAEMLQERLKDSPLCRYATNILKSGQRSAELTKQLLAFARKGKYLTVAVDVHEIVGEVLQILEHSIDRRIRLKTALKASPSTILGDPTQIQNALMNLAINARDAMPEGGELFIRTDLKTLDEAYCASLPYQLNPGNFLELSVSDSGMGMDREIQKRIFDPFFTTKEMGKGTGLGLASVYGIVKHHRGAIEVLSEVGMGSCFTLYLPLDDSISEAAAAEDALLYASDRRTILVVEDEPMVGEMLLEMLQQLGYAATLVRDGQEAVEHYQHHWHGIDLVILDMVMPRLSGKDAFRLLRRINPGAQILLSSGFSVEGEAQILLQEGAVGFLQKPYFLLELSQALSRLFAQNSGEPQAYP